jgi:hypothetical protein
MLFDGFILIYGGFTTSFRVIYSTFFAIYFYPSDEMEVLSLVLLKTLLSMEF